MRVRALLAIDTSSFVFLHEDCLAAISVVREEQIVRLRTLLTESDSVSEPLVRASSHQRGLIDSWKKEYRLGKGYRDL